MLSVSFGKQSSLSGLSARAQAARTMRVPTGQLVPELVRHLCLYPFCTDAEAQHQFDLFLTVFGLPCADSDHPSVELTSGNGAPDTECM